MNIFEEFKNFRNKIKERNNRLKASKIDFGEGIIPKSPPPPYESSSQAAVQGPPPPYQGSSQAAVQGPPPPYQGRSQAVVQDPPPPYQGNTQATVQGPSLTEKERASVDFYARGKNNGRGPSKGDTELDRTSDLRFMHTDQGVAVWQQEGEQRNFVTDYTSLTNQNGAVLFIGEGITSEQVNLQNLLNIVQQRILEAELKNYSTDTILNLESSLDTLEFYLENSQQPQSPQFMEHAAKVITAVKEKLKMEKIKQGKNTDQTTVNKRSATPSRGLKRSSKRRL